jgi:hypothetical protein
VYGPPICKKEKEKLPDEPALVVLVIPVGVCSATTVAPETFTVPRIPEVVSTSENTGRLKQITEEKRSKLFKIGFIINPNIN